MAGDQRRADRGRPSESAARLDLDFRKWKVPCAQNPRGDQMPQEIPLLPPVALDKHPWVGSYQEFGESQAW